MSIDWLHKIEISGIEIEERKKNTEKQTVGEKSERETQIRNIELQTHIKDTDTSEAKLL